LEIDKIVRIAVEEAVAANHQGPDVAKKIVAWIEALSEGNEELSSDDSAERHLAVLYESVTGAPTDEQGNT